jgi:hypothetical protein
MKNTPITLKNGKWNIQKRKLLWEQIGHKLYNENIDAFKKCAIKVLSEIDPQFDLPLDKRFLAGINGKVLSHSNELRKGIAEGLALLGAAPLALSNISENKAEATAAGVIREIFHNADWKLWGTLNNLLPTLAEASPEIFLESVEASLRKDPCPFDQLFAQESTTAGITGSNYLTGLLWALETLAWDPNHLSRACVILGILDTQDPGGKWANRPMNSLKTIFLPWLPQTMAPVEKRKIAIETLIKEIPNVAWKLLLALLPNQNQISSGSHKPQWRDIIFQTREKNIPKEEYWEQIYCYTELAISLAENNVVKLSDLVGSLHQLPEDLQEKILKQVVSKKIIELPEEERLKLWTELINFVAKHRKSKNADWTLPEEKILKVEQSAKKLSPSNPFNLFQRLFNEPAFLLYDGDDGWEKQSQRLADQRLFAIKTIYQKLGLEEVIRFAKTVKSPEQVGFSLGAIGNDSIDKALLPKFLLSKNKKLNSFVSNYSLKRYLDLDWQWFDSINKNNWAFSQIAELLSFLPFGSEAWDRAEKWLMNEENKYWEKTSVHPYQVKGDIKTAINKLISHGRPEAALDCIDASFHTNKILHNELAVKALLAILKSEQSAYRADTFSIIEIIKALQNDPATKPEEMFKVEWAYLPILERGHEVMPKTLENSLAKNPDFFCEVIQLVYRSKKKTKIMKKINEKNEELARNAWQLLNGWAIPPGMQKDGTFSQKALREWLDTVQKICLHSGHLDVAHNHIGSVLFYAPEDPDGLWIDKGVATILNHIDAEKMRRGFFMKIRNSRGAHWIDPTAEPELQLAKQYNNKSEQVEKAGYQRLAAEMRSVASSYERDAKRIINEFKSREKEEPKIH